VFHVTGITNSVPRGYTFRNFNVGIASGSGGQNVFHFDSTAGTTTGFAEVIIDNLVLPSTVSAGGNSIFLNNGSGVNGNGGTFNFTVSSCWIAGGIAFQQAGDTLRILNNIITGPKAGITLDQVGGAGQAVIMGNNITSDGGAIVIKQAIAPMIAFNEIESGATTEANYAIIDLIGNVSAGRIVCNEMQIIGGTAALIRLASSDSTYIDGNRLASAASFAVINTAAATNTAIGIGNSLSGGAAFMSDAGSGTIDPRAAWVPYNPAITFLGGSGVTASGTLAAYKKIGKTLYVRARATINYTTAPTEIKIPLPAGLLGVAGLEQVVPVYNYFNATPGIGLLTAGNNLFTIDVGLPTGSGQPIVLTGTIEVQ
jgi:hypothetical protein